MDPQKGTRSRRIPFGKSIAMDKPGGCPSVPRSASNVMVRPWIRRREPTLHITLQFVACHTSSVHRDLIGLKIAHVWTCSCHSQFAAGFLALSQTPIQCTSWYQENVPRASRTPSIDARPSTGKGAEPVARKTGEFAYHPSSPSYSGQGRRRPRASVLRSFEPHRA